MFDHVINTLGAAGMVFLIWSLVRAFSRKSAQNAQDDALILDDYLRKITRVTGHSVYDTFYKSAEGWQVSRDSGKRHNPAGPIRLFVKKFLRVK